MSSKPRKIAVVHTRSESLFEPLESLGWTPISCPVLDIVHLPFDAPQDCDVALISSIHAIPAAVRCGAPVVVVGEQTAQAAQENGLTLFAPPVDTVRDVLRYAGELVPRRVVHLSGADVADDTNFLWEAIKAKQCVVYKAMPCPTLPPAILSALTHKELAMVMIFSPRSAEVFTALANRATNNEAWRLVHGVALSQSVADAMTRVPFASIKVAAAPNRNSILEVLGHEQFSTF